jgi:hypothetical protein
MSSCATLSRSGASDCFLRRGAGDVGVKFGPFSEEGCVVGQEQGMLCPYADRWPLPANLENAQIFVIADARIDQVDEGREVIQIDFGRINVEERGKYRCSSLGRSFPAAGHDEDNAFLAAVGLTENHAVQGGPAPITQLRAHLGLCPDIFEFDRVSTTLRFMPQSVGRRNGPQRHVVIIPLPRAFRNGCAHRWSNSHC